MVQNAAARTRKYDHISPVLLTLHWLLMYLLHHKKIDIYANISLFLSYSKVTVATRSGSYPAQMVTAVTRSSSYPDQMMDQHLETTSTALGGDQDT